MQPQLISIKTLEKIRSTAYPKKAKEGIRLRIKKRKEN